MKNIDTKGVNLVTRSQLEAMAQMLEVQGRRLRELEVKLQKEKQEKADLQVDFHHLLDQLNVMATLGSFCDEKNVVCG